MENLFLFWLVIAILSLILEMGSPGLFYFLSLAIGGLLSAIISLYDDSLMTQCGAFLIGSIIAMLILKLGIGSWKKTSTIYATNIYALEGKRGIVLEQVQPQNIGLIKIEGQSWSAKTAQEKTIPVGKTVQVISCSGAYVLVEEVPEK